MTPEEWQRAKALFDAAMEREPEDRSAFLDEACSPTDDLVRREVETLLAAHEQSESFLESPAVVIRDASAAKRSILREGHMVGRYRVYAMLGSGGMGDVYLAEDPRLERKVALKLLPRSLGADPDRLRRFEQEARTASALSHPNVCVIYEVGEAEDDRRFIAMEYVEGNSLRRLLEQHRVAGTRMSVGEMVDIGVQIASGLAAAHAAGIVHRDVKPENVMVRPDGLVKVLDFGLAKLAKQPTIPGAQQNGRSVDTEPGMVLGTVQYMSPEQARGLAVDERTDVWSLGAVLYELLAGHAPFEGETASDIMVAVLDREPHPLAALSPAIPKDLQRIISRALSKDREGRHPTMSEFASELKRLQGGSAKTRPSRRAWTRLSPRTFAAMIAVAVVAVATAVFLRSNESGIAAPASVAVMPFANLSGRSDNEYLSDGIAEALINELGKIEGLSLAARTSSFAFKGSKENIRDIGSRLRVQNIVEGGVRRAGDSLRVTAHLINVANGYQVWSQTYDGSIRDLFAVQAKISHAIALALAGRLVIRGGQELGSSSTTDLRAYDLYLRGRFAERREMNQDNLEEAIALYKVSTSVDPNFALGYSAVGEAYYHLADDYLPPHQAYPKVLAAASAALKADSSLAEAHATVASYEISYGWNWQRAREHGLLAVKLKPGSSFAHMVLGWYYVIMGDDARAIAEAQKASSLDPFSDEIGGNVFSILHALGRHDLAIAHVRRLMSTGTGTPEFLRAWLAWEYLLQNEIGEARVQLDSARTINPDCCKRTLALIYAHSDAPDSALIILQGLEARRATGYYRADFLAEVRAALNDREGTFRWLDQAYKDRSSSFPYFLLRSVEIQRYRNDPRFVALVRLLSLPANAGSNQLTSRQSVDLKRP